MFEIFVISQNIQKFSKQKTTFPYRTVDVFRSRFTIRIRLDERFVNVNRKNFVNFGNELSLFWTLEQYGDQHRRGRHFPGANIRKHPVAQRSVGQRPATAVVHQAEDEIGPASQRVREKTRGSAARAVGNEQEYQRHFGSVSHTRC